LLRDANIQAQWGEPPSADDIRRRDDQRLLADPLLQAVPEDSEQEIVRALLESHDAAHVAAAFVRLYRKGQAAPEDLAPTQVWSPNQDRPERTRHERAPRGERADRGPPIAAADNFTPGAWVSLSVGRTKQAEPRWLIPMLCKAGGISKRQIGSIRVEQNETYVEIDAASVDEFIARIGKGGHIEKSIRVARLDNAPSAQRERAPEKAPHKPLITSPKKPQADYADRPKRAHKPAPKPAHRGASAKPDAKGRPGNHRKHADAKRAPAPPSKKGKWRPRDR
jgi:ATP-dependent RNA helicase DeaD